jgi:predicted histone-like DNA-binding protein
MGLFFNKVQRGKPGDPLSEKPWYLILKSTGLVRARQVARLLADETTLNPKEVELAVALTGKIAGRLLADGHTVELESLGTFYLTANSAPSATKEEVTAHNLKGIKIRFTPAPALLERVNDASLRPATGLRKTRATRPGF